MKTSLPRGASHADQCDGKVMRVFLDEPARLLSVLTVIVELRREYGDLGDWKIIADYYGHYWIECAHRGRV